MALLRNLGLFCGKRHFVEQDRESLVDASIGCHVMSLSAKEP